MDGGILLFLICIGSSLPFLGPLLIMMVTVELPLILWCGLLVLCLKGDGWFMLFVTWLCFLVLLLFGLVIGLLVLLLLLVLMMLPYTPGLLVKWVAFLGTLHWPAGGVDLGVGGISYVQQLILYELWAGERLTLEKAHLRYLRPGRPISVSAVLFGPGTAVVSLVP